MRIERTGSRRPLTPRVEQFLREGLSGIPLDEVVDHAQKRADYSCLRGLLVVEVKTLEQDSSERVANVTDELVKRPDWPSFFGAVPLEACLSNLEGDTEKIRQELLHRIGRSTKNHLRKANKQLRAHCEQFPRQNAARAVILVNEDHPEYDPDTVAYVVQRELKKGADEAFELDSIDCVVYLSERHASAEGEMLVLPIVGIEGYGCKLNPWKSALMDWVMAAWANWNGFSSLPDDKTPQHFETINVIPDEAPLHERWRTEYERRPHLRNLSLAELRETWDEVVLLSLLFGLKDSPLKITPQESIPIMKRFSDVGEELTHRHIPLEKVPQDRDAFLAAARRLQLSPEVVAWIEALGLE